MKRLFTIKLLSAVFTILLITASCNKRDYPCPGLGKSEEADISMFDENGKLKEENDRSRINKKNGMVKKKKNKKLNAPRKTHL